MNFKLLLTFVSLANLMSATAFAIDDSAFESVVPEHVEVDDSQPGAIDTPLLANTPSLDELRGLGRVNYMDYRNDETETSTYSYEGEMGPSVNRGGLETTESAKNRGKDEYETSDKD